jgi:HSP20 family protein
MTMLVPRRHRSLFDPFMNDPFDAFFSDMPAPQATPNLMRTDIKETEDGIEIVIDLPGFDKENVAAELKDGVLKVSAKTSTENEENTGTYLRRERFSGQCSRQFFVGEDIEEADIKAKFDNGTLQISVPKKVEQPKLEESRTIAIEG